MTFLEGLTKSEIETGIFPFLKVIDGSVFYSASGLIPEIVEDCIFKKYNNIVQNIIYCDYLIGFGKKANDVKPLDGYQIFAERILKKEDLFPDGIKGNSPQVVEILKNDYSDDNIHGDLYINWMVFELIDTNETTKPKRYSILHVECIGTSIYDSVFYKDDLYPEILVIKQPNLFGGNGIDHYHHKIRKIALHKIVTYKHHLSVPEIIYYVELPGINEDDGFGWKQYEKIGILNNLPENKYGENIYKYQFKPIFFK